MRPLLAAALMLATFAPAEAQVSRAFVQILRPASVTPSGQGTVTVRVRFVKEVRLYVDGLYQGRRHASGSSSNTDLPFLVSYPGTAVNGRYTLRAEGKDENGDDFDAVESFVFPTRDRDVQTQLEVRAPAFARAPAASLYSADTSVTIDPDARYTLTISPSSSVVAPGGKVTFAVTIRERGTVIPDAIPSMSASGGSFEGKDNLTYVAPTRPGRYRVVARFSDGIISARIDVGQPVNVTVVSWGIHQLRLGGARFAAGTVFVDPNIRPTTTIPVLLLPEDKNKRISVSVEGLDLNGRALTAKVVDIDVR